MVCEYKGERLGMARSGEPHPQEGTQRPGLGAMGPSQRVRGGAGGSVRVTTWRHDSSGLHPEEEGKYRRHQDRGETWWPHILIDPSIGGRGTEKTGRGRRETQKRGELTVSCNNSGKDDNGLDQGPAVEKRSGQILDIYLWLETTKFPHGWDGEAKQSFRFWPGNAKLL